MSKEAMKLAQEWQNKDWNHENPMSAEYAISEANDVINVLIAALAKQEQGEPVAKVVLTETLGLPCLQWLDLNRQFDFKGDEYLYAHPQPKQEQGEPVAWRWMPAPYWKQWVYSDDGERVEEAKRFMGDGGVQPLYTTPQQRKPLTDEQVTHLWAHIAEPSLRKALTVFARSIEAAHGIKE
jgi:hypothetical protein